MSLTFRPYSQLPDHTPIERKLVFWSDLCLKSLWGLTMRQGPSEKCIWKIFYRAVLENGHPEVHEVHDHLELGNNHLRAKFIKAKWFCWSPWISRGL